MRIYMVTGEYDGSEKVLMFVRTEREAKSMVKHYSVHLDLISSVSYQPQDIGSNKEGLIKWLNGFTVEV